jgi:hypothetical protein
MSPQRIVLSAILILASVYTYAQQATIRGKVTDNRGRALDAATVAIEGTGTGTNTDGKGNYSLSLPAGDGIIVVFSYNGYSVRKDTLSLKADETREINARLTRVDKELKGVTVKGERNTDLNTISLDAKKSALLPTVGFGDGIEAMIKTLVGSNNELTSQYNVRGGNFDENLVYVNDFEIYRPFLTRSGQQEGMSFVNADLASGVNFSVGGFQSKYAQKNLVVGQ